jgi:hypothetical protein
MDGAKHFFENLPLSSIFKKNFHSSYVITMTRLDDIEKRWIKDRGIWIQEAIILLACFFYLLLKIHPMLIMESQQPVFFTGFDFLSEFLKIPGGLTDWFSQFFMQWWFSDFLGALLLTISFWFVTFFTKQWMGTLTENRPIHTFHLIPAVTLLVLHSQYDFHVSSTLALIINLATVVLFLRWAPQKRLIRLTMSFIISILLFWITGGAFFVFVLLYALDAIVFKKRFWDSLLFLLLSAGLPSVASKYFFLVTPRYAYTHNLTFENSLELRFTEYILPIFFILVVVIVLLAKISLFKKLGKKLNRAALVWKLAAGMIILMGGTYLLAKESTNIYKRDILQINRAVEDNRWADVLEYTRHCSNINPLVLCQTNLALYESGTLLDSMFSYPQTKGSFGLLMNQTWCLAWSEEASAVAWKLGLINDSQHWAHEALEHRGPTPALLKQLGMVYMLKGMNGAADRFFQNLKNVPFQHAAADHLIRLNEHPEELAQDSVYKFVQSCMLVEDQISREKITSSELELLIKRNPRNKMAFEYLIAYDLLNANVKGVWDHLPDFSALNYVNIPRHVQEAMIVIATMVPNFDLNKLRGWVSPVTFNRFLEYQKINMKYKEDRNTARQILQARFGDTYWYFLMFVKSAPRQSEIQNEYH